MAMEPFGNNYWVPEFVAEKNYQAVNSNCESNSLMELPSTDPFHAFFSMGTIGAGKQIKALKIRSVQLIE